MTTSDFFSPFVATRVPAPVANATTPDQEALP
jgi:hypothetical protein